MIRHIVANTGEIFICRLLKSIIRAAGTWIPAAFRLSIRFIHYCAFLGVDKCLPFVHAKRISIDQKGEFGYIISIDKCQFHMQKGTDK